MGVQIEDEAIGALLKMVGFPSTGFGHFTSGGTLANLEALVRARARVDSSGQVRPILLVPRNMHYSWTKGAHLLGLGTEGLWPIDLDASGRLSLRSLKEGLGRAAREERPVLIVVSVLGSTELGSIDPIHDVQDCLDEWESSTGKKCWHHVDAAYGGFFRTLDLDCCDTVGKSGLDALRALPRVTSVTLDPHKLGYVPYATGAFLVRDRKDYFVRTFDDAPYIDFDAAVDRGPYTLEGSRSAAGAAATWMTAEAMGLHSKGFGLIVERTTRMSRKLEARLKDLPLQLAPGCDTNLVCFSCARPGEALSESNRRTLELHERLSPRGKGPFMVSKTSLRWEGFGEYLDQWSAGWNAKVDVREVALIRMCLMNPFFGSEETSVYFPDELIQYLRTHLTSP